MSLAEYFTLLHWDLFIWIPTFVNPLFMVPQLRKLWRDRDTGAISLPTLWLLIFIQVSFSFHGLYLSDAVLITTNGLASITTLSVIASVIYLRYRRRREFRVLLAPE